MGWQVDNNTHRLMAVDWNTHIMYTEWVKSRNVPLFLHAEQGTGGKGHIPLPGLKVSLATGCRHPVARRKFPLSVEAIAWIEDGPPESLD